MGLQYCTLWMAPPLAAAGWWRLIWLLLLQLAVLRGTYLPEIVRVDAVITSLDCQQHAFVVVAVNRTNRSSSRGVGEDASSGSLSPFFTCEEATAASLLQEARDQGALVFSWGRWDTSTTAADPGCSQGSSTQDATPQRSRLYLRTDTTYVTCGVSFYNDAFGTAGSVSLTERSSGRSLLLFDTASILSNGSSAASTPLSQCAVPSGGGQACSFSLGALSISPSNCSDVQREVAPGISFCASLNRSECSLQPQTCAHKPAPNRLLALVLSPPCVGPLCVGPLASLRWSSFLLALVLSPPCGQLTAHPSSLLLLARRRALPRMPHRPSGAGRRGRRQHQCS